MDFKSQEIQFIWVKYLLPFISHEFLKFGLDVANKVNNEIQL